MYDPAWPSVAFSCVCEVSDSRCTVAVLVLYPLLPPADFPAPNSPATSAPASPAATTTTTATAAIQPRLRRPAGSAAPPGVACSGTADPRACSGTAEPLACSHASVLLI